MNPKKFAFEFLFALLGTASFFLFFYIFLVMDESFIFG